MDNFENRPSFMISVPVFRWLIDVVPSFLHRSARVAPLKRSGVNLYFSSDMAKTFTCGVIVRVPVNHLSSACLKYSDPVRTPFPDLYGTQAFSMVAPLIFYAGRQVDVFVSAKSTLFIVQLLLGASS